MKKITAVLILFALIFSTFCSCAANNDDGKINIIATVFPAYDLARAVGGDAANVKMLLPAGAESHTYEPSAKDIIDIANCDLFIYTGGESDEWVDGILSSLDKPVRTLKMIECVEAEHEMITQGMQHEHDEHSHGEEKYDEHVWTSPKNAVKICEAILIELCDVSIDNAEVYKANFLSYTSQIKELDAEFEEFFEETENKTLIFGDRFPFQYFAGAYGLDYFAAFPGCSADTEPSMATVAFLIDKVKSENIGTVFYIEFSNQNIANAIAEATGADTALLHSCHNVSSEELAAGVTYVSLMRKNLETLKGTD